MQGNDHGIHVCEALRATSPLAGPERMRLDLQPNVVGPGFRHQSPELAVIERLPLAPATTPGDAQLVIAASQGDFTSRANQNSVRVADRLPARL